MGLKKIISILTLVIILTTMVLIIPAAPVAAALVGTITGLSTGSAIVGSVVYITGTGYTVGSTPYIDFGGTSIATSSTIAVGGGLNVSFTVPAKPRNIYNVTVTTSAPGNDTSSNIVTVTVVPSITLSAITGIPGDQITVSGNGYAASSTITLIYDNATIGTSTIFTDSNGSFFNASMTIPQSAKGGHTVKANDAGGYSATTPFTVNPKLAISQNNVSVGSQVTLSGTGFAASSLITYAIDGTPVTGSSTNSDATGSFSASFTVPANSRGTHTLQAQDSTGGAGTVSYSLSQGMTASPLTGMFGTLVTVNGNGFNPNVPITITFGPTTVIAASSGINTDINGSLNVSFKVPGIAAGTYTIQVSDGANASTANFTVTALAKIDQSKVAVGATITATGNGFKANSPIVVNIDGIQAATGISTPNGEFSISFKAPSIKGGDHAVTITDGATTVGNMTLNITAVSAISITSGFVGSDIQISGSAFQANKTVTVTYDNQPVTTTSTAANGSFSATFKAPASKGGSHNIVVSDGTTSMSFKFDMDSAAPPVPALLLPVNGSKPEEPVDFDWGDVQDPSGATYWLQAATDFNFNGIIIDKKGLEKSGYVLAETEKLQSSNEPYYWRVKAIDGAFNESDWSIPQTFYIGLVMPAWVLYAIFGVVVVLVGLLGFFFGRRTARYH